MDFTLERKSIHELSNHLTIIQGAVTKVLKGLQDKRPELSDEQERLRKADDYLKKSLESLKELRAAILEKIQDQEESP